MGKGCTAGGVARGAPDERVGKRARGGAGARAPGQRAAACSRTRPPHPRRQAAQRPHTTPSFKPFRLASLARYKMYTKQLSVMVAEQQRHEQVCHMLRNGSRLPFPVALFTPFATGGISNALPALATGACSTACPAQH